MTSSTSNNQQQIQEFKNERNDAVSFLLFETMVLCILAIIFISLPNWLAISAIIINLLTFLLLIVRQILLHYKKTKPRTFKYINAIYVIQALLIIGYFLFKAQEIVVIGLLITFLVIEFLSIILSTVVSTHLK